MRRSLHALALVPLLLALGCGDAPEENATTPYAASPAAPPATTADTPEAIGDAVAAIYVDTMKKVVATLEDRPEVDVAKTELARVKEQAIAQLVALGKKRQALDDAGKAIVNRKVTAGLMRIPSDVFQAFSEAHKHYTSADRETGNLLAAFNILTQYADFELLKKQAPAELQRLGLGE